eukprot:TRINITY_DN4853_c0_g1_i1.p1 TRINITY_DN4853_c0_g1~~TRINITY_DN4853_c0_g1_i1.p1  ORF type:complete len:446 (-),score=101.14 TRINITY_DN4853_c0_g1_i1:15-1352(-)
MKLEKRNLYQLILAELHHSGFQTAATALSEATLIPLPSRGTKEDEENRLFRLMKVGLYIEKEREDKGLPPLPVEDLLATVPDYMQADLLKKDEKTGEDDRTKSSGLDFDAPNPPRRIFPNFTTKFITTHKNSCRVAKFSPDGKFVATGSSDTSIKVLDVEKMKTFNHTKSEHGEDFAPAKPVTRTFYDHTNAINDLDFHPVVPVLISSSKDCTIKFYDHSQNSVKRAFKHVQDTHNIRSINFHPSGEYILSGTEHPVIRLYDINNLTQPYTSSRPQDHHLGPINQVRYAPEGNIFVSCSKDGSIKLWDAVSHRVINTIQKAHNGAEPTSVQFSANQKYLLSGGKDATIRLWELTTGRQLQHIITGSHWKHRLQVAFTWNEDFILSSDENGYAGVVWDTRSGDLVQRLTGHTNVVLWTASSPVENSIITCSNDHRARFWVAEPVGQ